MPEASPGKGAGKAAEPQSRLEQGKDTHVPDAPAPPTCSRLSGNIIQLPERMKRPYV